MKKAAIVLLAGSLFLILAGAALAGKATGVITAVDAEKGVLTLDNGTRFDGVPASLLKYKAGTKVIVEYKEEGGKKVVTKITPEPIGC